MIDPAAQANRVEAHIGMERNTVKHIADEFHGNVFCALCNDHMDGPNPMKLSEIELRMVLDQAGPPADPTIEHMRGIKHDRARCKICSG